MASKKDEIAEVAEVIENENLTDQEQEFCLVYSKCFNPRRAYQKTFGCADAKEAERLGRNLLRCKRIKEEIKELKKLRFSKAFVDEDDILQKHLDIAFADMTDIVDIKDGMPILKDSAQMDGSIIAEIRFGKTSVDVRMVDKQKSLMWLSDNFGQINEEQKLKREKLKADIAAISGRDITEGGVIKMPAVLPTKEEIKNNGKAKKD